MEAKNTPKPAPPPEEPAHPTAAPPLEDNQIQSSSTGLEFDENIPSTPIAAPPTATSTVMDVVAPRDAPSAAKDQPPSTDQKTPPAEKPSKSKKAKAVKLPKPPKAPRQKSNGVGLAIGATVIIVLGLGILVVYAYLKTR